jgi:outer membrane protein OmpA-like peptidoglycan-associated protein
METKPMPLAHVSRRRLFRRALTQAFVLSLIPLGSAFAQSNPLYPYVRVTRDETEIKPLRGTNEVRMWAPKGTVMEVIHIEGDRYQHRDSNWYWVLLPRDPWATRPAGWVRGDKVEHVPAPVPAAATAPKTAVNELPQAKEARNEAPSELRTVAMAEAAPVEEVTVAEPVVFSDVVLNFQFGRSELTEEAKRKLASAVVMPKPNARVSVALEGHADWTGPETYNEQLGLDRAESVRRYLAEQLRIPVGQISVTSYGENSPAAPNTTREGRAHNRRVVIKAGA